MASGPIYPELLNKKITLTTFRGIEYDERHGHDMGKVNDVHRKKKPGIGNHLTINPTRKGSASSWNLSRLELGTS